MNCIYVGHVINVNSEVGAVAQLVQPVTCEPKTEIWGARKQIITAR